VAGTLARPDARAPLTEQVYGTATWRVGALTLAQFVQEGLSKVSQLISETGASVEV
jgi:hypothetical protein